MSASTQSRIRPLQRSDTQAFTLVEMLVAITVMVMLITLVASIMQSGEIVISRSRTHLSADAEARAVYSLFEQDLNNMPRRADLDVLLSASNSSIFFYTEVPGIQKTTSINQFNRLSLVGYRVSEKAQLERLGKGLSWSNLPYLAYDSEPLAADSNPLPNSTIHGAWGETIGSSPAFTNGADEDYHVLAEGVFRIFYCFQKRDGTFILGLPPNALKERFADVSALILTLAVLDVDSRKICSDTSKLAQALPNPVQADLNDKKLPGELWQAAVDNARQFSQDASIPISVAGKIRIYQRSFPLVKP